eukprot:TRINITY_DN51834_c0_g1_i1.p1 TRINITY_DN51834_c0_g1~~TRINITY_DN51834_c0_g1_i1.p1  ORF type:complete len:187 (-),score=34.96 TRINITY_DN51834_c0_g1_i1:112-672(-)
MRHPVVFLFVSGFLASLIPADVVDVPFNVEGSARNGMRFTSEKRVEVITQSIAVVDGIMDLPTNLSEARQTKIVQTLEDAVKQMKESEISIDETEKNEQTPAEQERSQHWLSTLKPADQAKMKQMTKWSEQMNKKIRNVTMDVISKLENAIRHVKKGALSGNVQEANSLNSILQGQRLSPLIAQPK